MKKNYFNLFVLFFLLSTAFIYAQTKKSTFEIKDGQFLLNGKAVSLHSGEMHYSRIPQQY